MNKYKLKHTLLFMMNFTMSKDNSIAKIKAEAKVSVTDMLLEKLSEIFGAENVGMVRVGNSTSKSNEIGVRLGTVTEGSETYDICATVNATAKEFVDRKTSKKTYAAFDFDAARQEYEDYLDDKAAKESEKAAAKAKKIEKDTAARKSAE